MLVEAVDDSGAVFDSFSLAPAPQISSGAAVNAATYTNALAPGALMSIFGLHLAVEESLAPRLPYPELLAGVRVTLDGRALPLLFVSPGQLNTVLPFSAEGRGTVRVTTANGVSEIEVNLQSTAPGIFLRGGDPALPAILGEDGAPISIANPARAGRPLSIYCTGLGRVQGELAPGAPAPLSTVVPTLEPVLVQFGGLLLAASFAGLAPGYVGLYQVNVVLPETLRPGQYFLALLAGGNRSNQVLVDVR
jgi:uncharacterized protein (TIGR03437 family)